MARQNRLTSGTVGYATVTGTLAAGPYPAVGPYEQGQIVTTDLASIGVETDFRNAFSNVYQHEHWNDR